MSDYHEEVSPYSKDTTFSLSQAFLSKAIQFIKTMTPEEREEALKPIREYEEELARAEYETYMECGLVEESPYWKAGSERRARRRKRITKDEDD